MPHALIHILKPLDIILPHVGAGLDFNDFKRLGPLVGEAVFRALRDIRRLINRECKLLFAPDNSRHAGDHHRVFTALAVEA